MVSGQPVHIDLFCHIYIHYWLTLLSAALLKGAKFLMLAQYLDMNMTLLFFNLPLNHNCLKKEHHCHESYLYFSKLPPTSCHIFQHSKVLKNAAQSSNFNCGFQVFM